MKVAIYCRLSDEDRNKQSEDDDSVSIQNQKSMLIQYAIDHDWEIYKIYSDDDYAGADRSRPEFKALLADAEAHKFDIVLCKTQSRFTRELELVEKYIHGLFPIWNIRFVSIVDNADTDNKGNKKSRQINGLVNEWYLEDMSDNIRSVLVDRRKKGYHIGPFALYGYQKDPNCKGHLIIDPEAADVVREVYQLYLMGYGKTAIARKLNNRGIPNPKEYKRLKGSSYRALPSANGTLWNAYSIASMLTNEMYIGNMVQGKYGSVSWKTKKNKPRAKELWYRVEGTHEAIIDDETWKRVQAKVAERTRAFDTGEIGIFAYKAKCMYCGYTMWSKKNHGYRYLGCSRRHLSKDACIGSSISVLRLERAVIQEINNMASTYLDRDELEDKVSINYDMMDKRQRLEKQESRILEKIETDTKALKSLYVDKLKGIVCEKDYIDLSSEFTKERDELEQQLIHIRQQLENIDLELKQKVDKQKIIEEYMNLEHLDRPTVEKLIDYIRIGKKNPDTGEIPIEIHWNF